MKMGRRTVHIIACITILLAAVTACTPSQQNPQVSPTQQGALPDVDYSIPNEPMRGAGIVVYDDKVLIQDNVKGRIISCNLNGKDAKTVDNIDIYLSELSQSKGWLYYLLSDGIYKIKTNGQNKTKILSMSVDDSEGYIIGPSMAFGDSLYYVGTPRTSMNNSFYCLNTKGTKQLFEGIGNDSTCFTIYNNYVYYSASKGVINHYDLATGKTEKLLDEGGYCFSIVNDKLYYAGKDNCLYVYDLKTKENTKLTEQEDFANVNYSVQFHNYLLYFYPYKILGYDINTKKIYTLGSLQFTDFSHIFATNDAIYMMPDENLVYKLYFKDGQVNLEQIKALNDAIKDFQ